MVQDAGPDPATLLADALRRPVWHARAACRGSGPEVFFRRSPAAQGAAAAVCGRCPVAAECAKAGATEVDGVWGGLTPAERRLRGRVRRPAAQVVPPKRKPKARSGGRPAPVLLCANCATRPVAIKSQGLCRACHLYRWRKLKAEAAGAEQAYDASVAVTDARRTRVRTVQTTVRVRREAGIAG